MTRAQAEDIFTTCKALADVLRKDVRELCRSRGMPEDMLEELLRASSNQTAYDQFFSQHSAGGEIKLSEREIVLKLRNFGIEAGLDDQGNRWIRLPKSRDQMNSVELGLCRALTTRYSYQFR